MTVHSVGQISALYRLWGPDRYDEEITQLDHSLQCAAHACAAGAPPALIVAALLHDIGHLLDLEAGGSVAEPISAHHEDVGAAALAGLFPPTITAPIALHVRAKRYLAATEPDYLDALSKGSVASLARQGGPMSAHEALAFERNPGFADACTLRRWDDLGKVDGLAVEPFETYLDLLNELAIAD
jgi:phosphonate degradation associated HDIG domain protein